MACESECLDEKYGSNLFCSVCGMDVELNPIIKKGSIYCCKECVKNGKQPIKRDNARTIK